MEEEKKCPICGNRLFQYVYGLMDDINIDLSKYVVGGCMITPNSPKYLCKVCKKNFDEEMKEIGEVE